MRDIITTHFRPAHAGFFMPEMATGHFQVTSYGQLRTNPSPPNQMKLNTKNAKVNSVTSFIHKSFITLNFMTLERMSGYVSRKGNSLAFIHQAQYF